MERNQKLKSVMSPKEWDAFCHFYRKNGGGPLTLEQMGAIYGISKEAVRQIIERAIKKMRRNGSFMMEAWEYLGNE